MTLTSLIMLAAVFGSGAYLLLSFRYSNAILGLALLSNGINLLLIESSHNSDGVVDPLPQALILTAIVIGFSLLALVSAYMLNRLQTEPADAIPKIIHEEP